MNARMRDAALLLTYCGMIFWLSSLPNLTHPEFIANQDKLHHLAAYALMGWLSWRCFSHVLTDRTMLLIASVAFCSLYGLSDEWHQSFVVGRCADSGDWLADTLGAAMSVFALLLIPKPRRSV